MVAKLLVAPKRPKRILIIVDDCDFHFIFPLELTTSIRVKSLSAQDRLKSFDSTAQAQIAYLLVALLQFITISEAQMKAIRIHEFGPTEQVLKYEDVPTPEPGPNEVLIKIEAAALNRADLG